MSSAHGGVRVLNKAGALLEALAAGNGPQTVVQLAEATGEPRTTIYRLLATLQPMGWVEETTKRGRYVLGLRLVQLGRAAIEQGFERRVALPVLRALRNESGLTVYLTVLRGLRAVCVERMDGREVLTFGMQFGGSLPLHAGAGPNVLLAFSEPVVYQRFHEYVSRRGEAEALTPRTPRSLTDIESLVKKVRHNGYAVSSEANTIGIAAIGAPVLTDDGHCLAAVSLAGTPEEVLSPRRQPVLIDSVRRAARRVADLSTPGLVSALPPEY
jgi:DNA-binding IclR family transcriptional regulator